MSIFRQSLTEEVYHGMVEHAHSSSVFTHFHRDSITASQSFIVFDISDTAYHKHTETFLAHLDKVFYRVDADPNASYSIRMWAISDINATDCTRAMVWSDSGAKATDVNLRGEEDYHPYGPLMIPGKFGTTMIEEDYTGYNTGTLLATTKNPDTADTAPGNGDVVMEFIMNNSNPIEPHFQFMLHTHSEFHR